MPLLVNIIQIETERRVLFIIGSFPRNQQPFLVIKTKPYFESK